MTIFLVKYSTGSWDDFSVHTHSAWDSEQIATGITEKINAQISAWSLEKEPQDEEGETHIDEWLNWHRLSNCNKAWVEPILVNHIVPDREIEFKI